MNLKAIEEGLTVRAALEGLAAREAYGKLTPDELMEMGRTLDQMRKAGRSRRWREYFGAHKRLHEIFINGSRNQVLINLLDSPRMDRDWYPPTDDYQVSEVDKSIAVHQKILDMFRDPATNPQDLALVVRGHIGAARDKLFVLLGSDSQQGDKGYALQ